MKRSKNSHKMDELFRRLDAEDRAVVDLGKLPPHVALATALTVERTLATIWEDEQNWMIRTGDPREVIAITISEKRELDAALAKISKSVQSNVVAEHRIINRLMKFPPDRAWWTAHKVTKWAEFNARREQIQVAS